MDDSEYEHHLDQATKAAQENQQVARFVRAFCAYLYNTSAEEIVRAVFPLAVDDYIKEKVANINRGSIASFVGYLDEKNFARFVANFQAYYSHWGIHNP